MNSSIRILTHTFLLVTFSLGICISYVGAVEDIGVTPNTSEVNTTNTNTSEVNTTNTNTSQTNTQNTSGSGLRNPLKFNTIQEFLTAVVEIILVFAIPIIVFFLILGGFKLVTAQGKPEEINKAKSMIMWAIIGGVIVLGATALVKVIEGTVNAFKS